MDETLQSIEKLIYEHNRDMETGDDKNTLEKYNLETNLNFNDFKMLVNIHNKQHRKIVKSSFISNYNTIRDLLFFLLIII